MAIEVKKPGFRPRKGHALVYDNVESYLYHGADEKSVFSCCETEHGEEYAGLVAGQHLDQLYALEVCGVTEA